MSDISCCMHLLFLRLSGIIDLSKDRTLNVKFEHHDVSLLHHVLLALLTYTALLLGTNHAVC